MSEETRNRDQVAKGSRISSLSRRIIPKLSDRPKAANLEAAAQEREPRMVTPVLISRGEPVAVRDVIHVHPSVGDLTALLPREADLGINRANDNETAVRPSLAPTSFR